MAQSYKLKHNLYFLVEFTNFSLYYNNNSMLLNNTSEKIVELFIIYFYYIITLYLYYLLSIITLYYLLDILFTLDSPFFIIQNITMNLIFLNIKDHNNFFL